MRTSPRSLAFAVALAVSGTLVAACGGGGSGSSSGPTASPTGQLDLALTDGPIEDAQNVNVVFTGVELARANGERVNLDFAQPRTIDVLALRDGRTVDLTNGWTVPAGEYQWMRLKVVTDPVAQDASHIQLVSGMRHNLRIPSGDERGLQLFRPFVVGQGSRTQLVVDFDLRKSITAPPGQSPMYMMRPTLRLLNRLEVGRISASFDLAKMATDQLGAGAAQSSCDAGFYLYADTVSAPDDMDANEPNPVIYWKLPNDGATNPVTITIPFVEAGKAYKLAATCKFGVDRLPDVSEYDPATAGTDAATMKWTPLVTTPAVVAGQAVTAPAL
jgi:hypothetical protein